MHLWLLFIRTFFRLLYGPCAWTYDLVAWAVSLGQWTAWGRVALRAVDGPPVLELAHGPGHLQAAMSRQGLHPVGVDLSPQMGHLAQRRLRRAAIAPRLVQAQAQALPFRDGCFGGVVATFPTEFILDPRTAHEVERVLAVGGHVGIVAGCRLTGRGLPARFLEWLYQVTGQREPLPRGDETAWRIFDDLRVEWVPCRASQVLLICAEKPRRPTEPPR